MYIFYICVYKYAEMSSDGGIYALDIYVYAYLYKCASKDENSKITM